MRSKNNRIYKRVHRKSIVKKNKRKSIVRKKQYGGSPPLPFYDILTVNYDDKSLLMMIYSNLDMFINALNDNNIPNKRLEGIKTRWVSSVQNSDGKLLAYWKGVRLMECFKHSSFDYNNTINEIFLQTFFAEYDMGDKKYILKENIKEHELPFIFYRQLGPQGKVGTPYLITHQSTKTTIIMKISNNIRLNIDVVCAPESNSTCLECSNMQKNTKCFPKTGTIEYIVKSSEFINETIIGYVLNTIFFPKHNDVSLTLGLDSINNALNGELLEGELGNSVYQIGHFQSNDNYGSNIMEQADAELDKLFKGEKSLHTNEHFQKIKMEYNDKQYFGCNPEHKDIIITMLLLQLSKTLKIVADELGMIHGDLKAGNVFFSIKDNYFTVNYPLNDTIKIKTNIRLKIADYGKSSIIYKGIRFYCDSLGSELTNTAINPAKDANIEVGDKYSTGFGLNIKGVSAAIKLRNLPCPYFRSFDLYCVIVSLAIQSKMFMEFYTDNQINLVLFGYGENIPFKIQPKMNIASINTAIWILNQSECNSRFKCNAIEECIEKCITKLDEFKRPYRTELVSKIDDIIRKYKALTIDEDIANDSIDTSLVEHTYENNLKKIEAITNMTKKLQYIPNNCAYRNLTIESIKIIIDDINTIYDGISKLDDKAVKNNICQKIVTNLTIIKENITPFYY